MKSVLWGRWFPLCLCLMYENHKRNSIGCGLLNRAATFYGLCTCGWHRLSGDRNGIVCFAVEAAYVISLF